MRFVKNVGCYYNQSGLLKIEILILLNLERFQNLGTPPKHIFSAILYLSAQFLPWLKAEVRSNVYSLKAVPFVLAKFDVGCVTY